MTSVEAALELIESVKEELESNDCDYSWIAKVMTKEQNILLIHKALESAQERGN